MLGGGVMQACPNLEGKGKVSLHDPRHNPHLQMPHCRDEGEPKNHKFPTVALSTQSSLELEQMPPSD